MKYKNVKNVITAFQNSANDKHSFTTEIEFYMTNKDLAKILNTKDLVTILSNHIDLVWETSISIRKWGINISAIVPDQTIEIEYTANKEEIDKDEDEFERKILKLPIKNIQVSYNHESGHDLFQSPGLLPLSLDFFNNKFSATFQTVSA